MEGTQTFPHQWGPVQTAQPFTNNVGLHRQVATRNSTDELDAFEATNAR